MYLCFELLASLWKLGLLHFGLIFFYTTINLIRTNKLKGKRLHSTFRLIHNFFALNNGGEICKGFLEIYPTKLELKMGHSDSHKTFLDLDVSIDKCKFRCLINDV